MSPHRGDNRTDAPTRPFHVTHDELARAVRQTFAQQVAEPRPLSADPAGAAIRRARRIQRKRTATGLALAAVATVVVSTGVAQLGAGPRTPTRPTVVLGDPSNLARPEPLPSGGGMLPKEPSVDGVDLVVDNAIVSGTGERVPLTGIGPAERAQRLPDGVGWLVTSGPTTAGRSLWAVPRRGAIQVLLAGADAITVATDGRQVAWRDSDGLHAAGIVGTQLISAVRTPAAETAAPVGFVGNAVLVRLDEDRPGHALWRPAVAPLAAGTDRTTLTIYGALPDGRLVGQVPDKSGREPCLALLDPGRELAPVHTGCGPTLAEDGLGAVSPDGRWLLLNGRTGGSAGALLVDLNGLGADKADGHGKALTVHRAGPALTGAVDWSSAEDATYVDASGELVRLSVKQVMAGEPAVPAQVPGVGQENPPVVVTGS
ncbi:hypothetical protein [Micromonospora costi]|uniref:WD40 repeat domain-containing protein n=1 Tax=Micromonospora costi TaxID=1530042 RepID=A0A3B0ADP4_9ACTN|nr:hypothetical protein [Micromonospora costi]RKN58499.1 hypothetical protein D7193_08160 [Micromonospora costi]